MTEFEDFIDVESLEPDEAERLRRVHDLLLEAGPPAELPPRRERPGETPSGEIIQFPSLPKRRWAVAAVAAAAVAVAAFGGGYLFGHSKARPAAFTPERVVEMSSPHQGVAGLAVLRVERPDAAHNWPMELTVQGLPPQKQRNAYYELWLVQKGKPDLPCGVFRVHDTKTTTVRLSVPYSFKHARGWVVTRQQPGGQDPGPVVLTT